MPVTWQGPASTTLTRSTRPSSPNTWVIPSFLPNSAAIPADPLDELDLDVDAGREVVESLERVDRLRRRLKDVDQALVRPDLEVLARVLVLERTADHAVAVLLRRQRHGPRDRGARAGGRLDDLTSCLLDRRGVVGLEPDADLVLSEGCHGGLWTRGGRAIKDPPRSCVRLVTRRLRSPPPSQPCGRPRGWRSEDPGPWRSAGSARSSSARCRPA